MTPDATRPHDHVREEYRRRAAEYAEALGSMEAVHPSDRALVEAWAGTVAGPVIDAGCGPGHWSRFLQERGVEVSGVDMVPEFIDLASRRFPTVTFREGTLDALGVSDAALGGILSWYSVIHLPPADVGVALTEFARCLRPGGGLLLGFFDGARQEAFDHAVVTAYRWPIAELSGELQAAGFDIVETHTRTGPGARPHGAIVARRADR